MLFVNNPHAAGEQNRFQLNQNFDPNNTTSSFNGYHVGIVASNVHKHHKSDKIRALLTYICGHVEVGGGETRLWLTSNITAFPDQTFYVCFMSIHSRDVSLPPHFS